MRDATRFEDAEFVKDFLARKLVQGRLSVVLGAGASKGFGLPDWVELIQRIATTHSATLPPDLSSGESAEYLLNNVFGANRANLLAAVRRELYQGVDLGLPSLQRNPLVGALGALMMASSRGHVSQAVTFNYDDLLELYLQFHGYDSESIASLPAWQTSADVQILHPHGVLPSDSTSDGTDIVITQADYDRIVGKSATWRSRLIQVLSSHTCLFIGLSGADTNLSSILLEVGKEHAGKDAYWGVRFSNDVADARRSQWEARGVSQYTVASHSDLPNVLLEICQRAAEAKRVQRH